MENQIDFSSFKHTTKEEWIQKIEAEFKGQSIEKLNWPTFDGLGEVFLTASENANSRFSTALSSAKSQSNKWGVELSFDESTWPFYADMGNEGVDVLNVDARFALTSEQFHLPNGVEANLFLDAKNEPNLLVDSYLPTNLAGLDWESDSENSSILHDLFQVRKSRNASYSLACANGLKWSNKGAYISQELGFALAHGHDLLVELLKNGATINEASSCIQFKMGVGNSFFKEIAKFRALRTLWSAIIRRYEPKNESSLITSIRATNSRWNKTGIDEHTNLLRTTTEAMSAIIGGVDTMNVLPYNVFSASKSEAYRWSRNTQLLLREESFLNRVIDPGSGSYYIEDWSEKIANKAWSIFQEMEAQGGYFKCVDNGTIEAMCLQSAEEQKEELSSGDRVLIGANIHLNKKAVKTNDSNEERLSLEVEKQVQTI
jgi:hypothetical protein